MKENRTDAKKTVAVIGGGVAGIVAAHLLQDTREVTIFEKENYLGGHTHSVSVPDGPDEGTPVDTGFIVFNEATYPLFINFLQELEVPSRETQMSFGFHCECTGLTYAGTDLAGIFAQRSNLFSARYYRFLVEIARFCRQGKADLKGGQELGTLDEYLLRHRFSPFMVENYLLPMAAAIWSTPAGRVGQFPALSFLRFFHNHGLLSLLDRPRWRTVSGGSSSYVRAFLRRFCGTVRLDAPIARVLRTAAGVSVEVVGEEPRIFDDVFIAAHADQALRLLGDPSPEESRHLGAWRYEENTTVLHTDVSVLPPSPRAWACWNFRREAEEESRVFVTYAMNLLQGLAARKQYMVTLNRPSPHDESQVLASLVYHHPVYTRESMATQSLLSSLNGRRNTYFCGSYFGFGFHEDAVRSSHNAVEQFRRNG
ncbi:NAD(P)/FAD-dependent oxidoreductase [Desulfomicrobium baculatum]|uniref:Amine oxidase n=1 Tax=Desulfomicrobium baculatum (strain DSM 4028 / VKM B-1378 / X) TaxID=525897 RepID=C7LRK8_DESBD|nr:FAD-dependent oxidoreductase [Desulfomicrobium baculatum]ACU90516.1 amine oxidase [Desulfomicrobium baculatum DSM 4028]